MAPTTEAGLVLAIVKAIHQTYPDVWSFKVVGSPYQVAGIPDCLFCVRGLLIGLEVKHRKPGESREHALSRATPQQLVQIMRINRAGGVAGVVVSVQEALDLIGSGLDKERRRAVAHEITDRDGVFSVRQPMWHGLGVVLDDYPTRADAQTLVHPWEPVAEPIYRKRYHEQQFGPPRVEYEEIKGNYLNVRSDDDEPLGVVPNTYVTVTNDEMWTIAEVIEGEDKGSVQYETGGSLAGGRRVWLLLRLRDPIVVAGDPRGDTIPYYSLQNSHDGTGSFRGQATMTRIVCANTSQAADIESEIRGTSFEFHHTKNIRVRVEQAQQALAGWRAALRVWQEKSEAMVREPVTVDQRERFIQLFIPMPPPHSISDIVVANVTEARRQLKAILDGPTCEGIAGTSYGLVQASVEYLNHVRRAASNESRFKRAYLDRNKITVDAVRIAREVVHA